ncbi:hypothetical protein G432_13785 [Sphingomonas sp. MM-1]|uniref:TadE/TadG family type IV pilus assembly protein n=1 Tax=Sphingomonas sp. MM-1 TaxID=745310 RepID=UPI0002C12F6F|nr:TadE/TadG family type IV pilus assembly protein [Sphingomonas sp. MM-1]AGH50475.1 hypothetical protein G432_13785 [Sphingomonas sp. MM-1]
MTRARRNRLARDQRGATIVELAFVMLPFLGILLGFIDFGYSMYLGSVVEGTVHRAARLATVGDMPADKVDEYIRDQLSAFSNTATIEIEKTNYYEYSGIGRPEKITKDRGPVGEDPSDCFEDLNGDGIRNTVAGRAGLGGSDDIVYYKVTASFERLVPLTKIFGFSPTATVSSGTVLRNQPYASQTIPKEVCPGG